jgi:hypothetical protein
MTFESILAIYKALAEFPFSLEPPRMLLVSISLYSALLLGFVTGVVSIVKGVIERASL